MTHLCCFYFKKKVLCPTVFYPHNYGSRPKKSAHQALKNIKYWRTNTNFLIDYDISLNNGGWQWTGSTGTDPRGEPRIYNPVLQSSKLDPDCDFILKWLPELQDVKRTHIHDWEKYHHIYEGKVNYPNPIFSHYKQSDKAKKCS